jgi:hypothetical protein
MGDEGCDAKFSAIQISKECYSVHFLRLLEPTNRPTDGGLFPIART